MFVCRYKDDKKLMADGRIIIDDSAEGQATSTLSIEHFTQADVGQVHTNNAVITTNVK